MMPGSTPALGYIPGLRHGALLFTLLAFRYLERGRTRHDQVPIEIFGTTGGQRRNLFGENVSMASDRAFGGKVSPKEILLRHTFFGVYSRALPPVAADAWASAIVERSRPRDAWTILRTNPGSHNLATPDLRSCLQCVADDIDSFGFGQWHILHHVPALHYCPKHGCPLAIEFPTAGSGNRWRYALPRGLRPSVNTHSHYSASSGHSTYLGLWTQLLDGKLPVLAGRMWAEYMDDVVNSFGDLASANSEIEMAVEREWATSLSSIRANLGPHINENFVHFELSNNPAPARIAQKLIVLGAASTLGITPTTHVKPSQLSLSLGSSSNQAFDLPLQERLRNFLRDSMLPGTLAPFLLDDLSTSEIARNAGVHRRCIWRTMEGIPDQLLKEIASEREWSGQSWVAIERRRRFGRR